MGLVAIFAAPVAAPVAAIDVGSPQLVSHGANDSSAPTSGICSSPVLSPTGRFVLFTCQSSDVVAGEPGIGDLIQNDVASDVNSGVGLDNESQWGNCLDAEIGTCSSVGVASDTLGHQVVFNSGAPLTPDALQLIPGAGTPYVFLRDELASTSELLTPAPSQSDPAYLVGTDASLERTEALFTSALNILGGPDGNGTETDLYIRNWTDGSIELISVAPNGDQGDADTWFGVFSRDGRYVAFLSSAANLTNDNPSHFSNIFLRDRDERSTRRLTFPSGGGEFSSSPQFARTLRITGDDRYLLFGASGANFVAGDDASLQNLYLLDLASGVVSQLPRTNDSLAPNASVYSGDMSNDGSRLVFVTSATNVSETGQAGIFLQDVSTGQSIEASASLGALARPPGSSPPRVRVSSDGSMLAFEWPIFNSMFPTLLDTQQIYRASILSSGSQGTRAVPSTSKAVLAVSALLLLMLGLARIGRSSA